MCRGAGSYDQRRITTLAQSCGRRIGSAFAPIWGNRYLGEDGGKRVAVNMASPRMTKSEPGLPFRYTSALMYPLSRCTLRACRSCTPPVPSRNRSRLLGCSVARVLDCLCLH